jgi:ribonuclease P protein component
LSTSYQENRSFARPYRLKSRDVLNNVFENGRKVKSWPVILHFIDTALPEAVPCQAAVSVSKKRFKRAVDRNRIKRLLREAWRLEKIPVEKALHAHGKQRAIVFIFTGKEMPTYEAILLCVQTVLKKMPLPSDAPENEEVLS